MPIGSQTADINMINIAVTAADGSGLGWQSDAQMIPTTMNDDPEGFVAAIKAGLPLVNNLRVAFNEHSFNADGSMHPQFERFLAAAAAEGYAVTMLYSGWDTQDIGLGSADHPSLTNAQAYAALQDNIQTVQDAWAQMMDWMDSHADVAGAIYGYELMNEAAAYRHSIRANGPDDTYSANSFVSLYAQHVALLTGQIEARHEGKILVGGWGYNGDFLTLASQQVDGVSALDYIRAAVGDNLVWSAHLYPGWMGTNTLTDTAALIDRLDEIYGALTGDDVLITETNISGSVDDTSLAADYADHFAQSLEWFADNGIGLGWYPGVQTGASHLLSIDKNGDLTVRHQHSLAHALNAYSLGEVAADHAGDERVVIRLVDAAMRNETYEIEKGEGKFDAATRMGTGFGFGGDDTLQGADLSNDFLYGGTGRDLIRATGGDDFLFGQEGDDVLKGGTGIDHLFGGRGDDELDAGRGSNVLSGGAGDDTYVIRTARDVVREYAGNGNDTVKTLQSSLTLTGEAWAAVENLTYLGLRDFKGTGNALANILTGGAGDDTLSGGAGRDVLAGRGGADELSGGADADRFVFATGMGRDTVLDFADDQDVLVFQGLAGVLTAEDAMALATQGGADVVFDFAGAQSLTLRGVTLADLADDILVM